MITWQTPAGSLGIITERVIQEIPLEASSDVGIVTFSIIAGSLPRGLRLTNDSYKDSSQTTTYIKGSPVEVKRWTESRFVIRASDGVDIEDRTFSLSVDGSDLPEWITKEGFLQVGEGESYFVLDNSRVEFQLDATDTDLTAGDELEFRIAPMGGILPPGLTLSLSGLISGFTDPIFALEYNGFPNGGYDTAPMDVTPLDFVESRSNGFDTYYYDNVTYDYNEPSRVPRRLSRIYNFVVSVSDGVNSVNRLFKIFVVTEEFLQADNSVVQVDTNVFQADNASDRKPLWITESNLGRFRANNYVTIFLDVYDPPTLSGTITYFLLPTNPGTYVLKATGEIITNGQYEISGKIPTFPHSAITLGRTTNNWDPSEWTVLTPETDSIVPPGMELDSITGEIAGKVPYQAAITKDYQFTVTAVNFPATLSYDTYILRGDWNSYTAYAVNDAVRYLGFIYYCTTANKNKTPEDGSTYWFRGVSSANKTFTVSIIGEIESSIEWITPSDRGTIKPNQPSQIYVEARSQLYGNYVSYEFVSGRLPPGLSFLSTGAIEGKVKQFADDAGDGLTRFYDPDSSLIDSTGTRSFSISFDGGDTSFDKKFEFVIKARDSVKFAESLRTFYITVVADNTKTFANLYLKAFQSKSKRLAWYNFITDATIFTPDSLYRYGDTNYGIQTDLKMLTFAGIESVEAVNYVQSMSRNHYRKRLLFGDLKVAKAKDPETQETIYEVIYVEIIDDLEKNGVSISGTVNLSDTINSKVLISYDAIKVDSDIPFVSDSDHQRVFPNSIKNMRNRIKNVGDRDREFLPLWMRSIQDQALYELGFTKALVLCYTKPGKSADIVTRIKAKTSYASRGEWSNTVNYQADDSVLYKGFYYTCVSNNIGKNPITETKYWIQNFNFKLIDFTADRYLIDIIDGQIEDKYLAFPQRGEKLP